MTFWPPTNGDIIMEEGAARVSVEVDISLASPPPFDLQFELPFFGTNNHNGLALWVTLLTFQRHEEDFWFLDWLHQPPMWQQQQQLPPCLDSCKACDCLALIVWAWLFQM